MRIITAPGVKLRAFTVFVPDEEYPIPPYANDAEGLCAFAAKGCYDSFGLEGRSCEANQAEVIESRHGSVLEHYSISLWITGISRGCSHEIVRHRPGHAYSQRSTRYTAEEDASVVLEPYLSQLYLRSGGVFPFSGTPLSSLEQMVLDEHLDTARTSFESYKRQVHMLMQLGPNLPARDLRKWARGKARQSLPHCLETRMTLTGNLRSWRFFIEQRSSRWAEAEIRRLSAEIFPILLGVAPTHFRDYSLEIIDGIPEYTTANAKI